VRIQKRLFVVLGCVEPVVGLMGFVVVELGQLIVVVEFCQLVVMVGLKQQFVMIVWWDEKNE